MTKEEINIIRELAERHAGIELEAGKEYLIESRLLPVARKHGLSSLSVLIARLRQSPAGPVHTQVVEALTTQETFFFRDGHPFEALRNTILPDLVARRLTERRLDIWCGAASTGQEPYSVAMMLREHFPQLAGWRVRILATDLADSALRRAEEGRFNAVEVGRGLEAAMLKRYFIEEGAGWRVRPEIRAMVEFRKLNLSFPWTDVPDADLILMRNVLIYFSVRVKKEVLKRLHRQLRPDGYLMLGAAETTMHLDDTFHVQHLERTTCYRPGKVKPLGFTPIAAPLPRSRR